MGKRLWNCILHIGPLKPRRVVFVLLHCLDNFCSLSEDSVQDLFASQELFSNKAATKLCITMGCNLILYICVCESVLMWCCQVELILMENFMWYTKIRYTLYAAHTSKIHSHRKNSDSELNSLNIWLEPMSSFFIIKIFVYKSICCHR